MRLPPLSLFAIGGSLGRDKSLFFIFQILGWLKFPSIEFNSLNSSFTIFAFSSSCRGLVQLGHWHLLLFRGFTSLSLSSSSVCEEDILSSSKSTIKVNCFQKWSREINEQYVVHAQIIRELIDVKENRLHITFPYGDDGLSVASYDLIINFLCTI